MFVPPKAKIGCGSCQRHLRCKGTVAHEKLLVARQKFEN